MAPARRWVQKKKKEKKTEKEKETKKKGKNGEGGNELERNLVAITKAVVARPIYCPGRDSSFFKYFPRSFIGNLPSPPRSSLSRRLGQSSPRDIRVTNYTGEGLDFRKGGRVINDNPRSFHHQRLLNLPNNFHLQRRKKRGFFVRILSEKEKKSREPISPERTKGQWKT